MIKTGNFIRWIIVVTIRLVIFFILLGVMFHLLFKSLSFGFYVVIFIIIWKFLKFLFNKHSLKGK